MIFSFSKHIWLMRQTGCRRGPQDDYSMPLAPRLPALDHPFGKCAISLWPSRWKLKPKKFWKKHPWHPPVPIFFQDFQKKTVLVQDLGCVCRLEYLWTFINFDDTLPTHSSTKMLWEETLRGPLNVDVGYPISLGPNRPPIGSVAVGESCLSTKDDEDTSEYGPLPQTTPNKKTLKTYNLQ